jgi:hypothetical protein
LCAIGDMNPLWIDPAHARTSRLGRLAAPPAFLYGVSWGAWDRRRGEGLPGVHGLHSRDCWTYYRPILDGDEIHAVKMLVRLEEKSGTYAGRSVTPTGLFRYFNQRDELVAKCLMPAFRVERHAGDAAMTDAKCQAGGVLSGLRVLDISHQYSGAFTASLLADLGASVVSIEHPAGSPIRTMLPKRGGESLHPANRRTPPQANTVRARGGQGTARKARSLLQTSASRRKASSAPSASPFSKSPSIRAIWLVTCAKHRTAAPRARPKAYSAAASISTATSPCAAAQAIASSVSRKGASVVHVAPTRTVSPPAFAAWAARSASPV